MADKTLNVIDLDRPGLRADLKDFLRSQDLFRDYDFDGSSLSVLIDLLAYNAEKFGFLTNMLFSEAFLDSSQLRSSVFSHAKELNYVPRSARSASANVTVTFTATGENQPYVIPKGSTFSTLVKNTQYVFSTPEAIICASTNNQFQFTTTLYEGEYTKDGYTFTTSQDVPNPTFRISNQNVDTSSLSVVVFEDDQELGDPYVLSQSLLGLSSSSKVFFLQASEDGHYEVQFGDGVVGYKPPVGSTVVLDYRLSAADSPNSAARFSINFDPTGAHKEASSIKVVTNSVAAGGAPPESLDSIKYYAPRWFQTQERTTVEPDYETLLKIEFPEIRSVSVHGGEDAVPPLYGRVVVSVAIDGLTSLPESRRNLYSQFLSGRMPLGIRAVFVDPNYTYLQVSTTVRYDTGVTTSTPSLIKSLVTEAIQAYDEAELNDFGATLRFSPFTSAIDEADPSIVSNSTEVVLYKKLNPTLAIPQSYSLDFQVPLLDELPALAYPHPALNHSLTTVWSSPIVYAGVYSRIEDDGAGNLSIVQDSGGVTNRITGIGSVDYDSGIVTIRDLRVDSYDSDSLRVYARARDTDVSSERNTILSIETTGIDVEVVPLSGER